MSRAVWALAVLAILAFVVYVARSPGLPPTPPQTAEQAEAEGRAKIAAYEAAHPESRLHLTKVSGQLGGFGSVMILAGTLQNDGDKPLKDPTIKCTLNGNSGTEIDSTERQLFERIPAHASLHFSALNMGLIRSQAKRFDCTVTSVTPG